MDKSILHTMIFSIRVIAKLFEIFPSAVLRMLKAFTTAHYDYTTPSNTIFIDLERHPTIITKYIL